MQTHTHSHILFLRARTGNFDVITGQLQIKVISRVYCNISDHYFYI